MKDGKEKNQVNDSSTYVGPERYFHTHDFVIYAPSNGSEAVKMCRKCGTTLSLFDNTLDGCPFA